MNPSYESDAVSVPDSALLKVTTLSSLLDPLSRSADVTLPVAPDNDLPFLPLNITTQTILETGESGKGFLVSYPGLPFRKIAEHIIIANDGTLQQGGIVQTSVDASASFIAARPTVWGIDVSANFLVNSGGLTSATVQGRLSGTEAFGGLSQLYQQGKTTAESFSMDALSQLIANPTMKLSGLNATEGIAYRAPPTNGEFIRLSDPVPIAQDSGANENLDWSLSNVVHVRQGMEDAEGWSNTITMPIGTNSVEFELPSISCDLPYHGEVTAMWEGEISDITAGSGTNYLYIDLYADLYDITRLETNKKTFQFRSGRFSTAVTTLPFWATMIKVIPDEDVDELHYTWTALKWRVVLSRTSSVAQQVITFPGPPVIATKISEPLYLGRGKAQAPVIISYAGLPPNAPLAINSFISLEVVPDTSLSRITSPKLRNASAKTWKMLNDFTNMFQKMGKSWFYAANGVGPYCPKVHSKEIKYLISAVFAKSYPQYAHLINLNHPYDNPEFASKATRWFRKLNRKLKRLGSKGLELAGDVINDVGSEALSIGKDILRQKAYQALGADPTLSDRENISQSLSNTMHRAAGTRPSFASGAYFQSLPSFSSRNQVISFDDFQEVPYSTKNERFLISSDPELMSKPRVFAVSETCIADSDYTINKRGDLWLLTYPTTKIMQWLDKVYGVRYEPKGFWSRIGSNYLIGHTGTVFSVPGVRNDMILLHVAEKSPLAVDYIGVGRGDSVTLAIHALAMTKQPINVAFTGPVINSSVIGIPKSTLHAKWLGDKGLPLVANGKGLYNTIPIESVKELPALIATYGMPLGIHSFSGRGRGRDRRNQSGGQTQQTQTQKTQSQRPPQQPLPARKPKEKAIKVNPQIPSQNENISQSRKDSQTLLNYQLNLKKGESLNKENDEVMKLIRKNLASNLNRLMAPTGRWYYSSPEAASRGPSYFLKAIDNLPAFSGTPNLFIKAFNYAFLKLALEAGIVYHSAFSTKRSKDFDDMDAHVKLFYEHYKEVLNN